MHKVKLKTFLTCTFESIYEIHIQIDTFVAFSIKCRLIWFFSLSNMDEYFKSYHEIDMKEAP